MAELTLKVHLAVDNRVEDVPYTTSTTAEDICTSLCRRLGIGTIARHLFALRVHTKQVFIMPGATFTDKIREYDLRVRFKVANTKKLKKIDIKAYDYYFHQARNDVLENKIPDLIFEKYRKELVGLGITDMYRMMLEKDIPQETVENDYKKYIPKEVQKRHLFFIKKPIHDTLSKIKKSGHDAWYVKAEYLRQLELMASEYLAEEYKALTEEDGIISSLIVRVSPFASEPGIKYCLESKKDKWHCICALEDLGFVSLRKDSTVEISRRNGIPFYLKFTNMPNMLSFVSLIDGYYRLSVKWTFNICKDVVTPSLLKLYSMKCHGPVGGEFSYAKLEEKRGNKPGCFILRESDSKYNIYYIDVCLKDSLKPQTFKLEYLSGDEFIFHNDVTRYKSLQQLMSAYNKEDGVIYLGECLPPSENEKSPLLLCQSDSLTGDSLIDSSAVENLQSHPRCINNKDLQIYKGTFCYIISQDSEDADTPVKKDYCRIRKCKSAECKIAGTGDDYIGKISTTRSNRTCQRWVAPAMLKVLDLSLITNSSSNSLNGTNMSDIVNVRSLNNNTTKERYNQANFVKKLIDLNNMFDQMGCKDKWKCLKELFGSGDSLKTRRGEIKGNVTNKDDGSQLLNKSEALNVTERLKGASEVYTTTFGTSILHTTENMLLNSTSDLINKENILTESFGKFSTTAPDENNELLTITPIWENSISNPIETHQNNETNNATLTYLSTSDNPINITASLSHQKEVAILANDTRERESQLIDEEETQTSRYDYPYIHKVDRNLLNETLYADMDLKKIKNYCRNPSRDMSGSWCYTEDPAVPIDLCPVKDCDKSEECTILLNGDGRGQKKTSSQGITIVYRGMWRHTKGKKIEVAMKTLKCDFREKYMNDFLDTAGHWAFLQSNAVVKLFGVTLSAQMSMILEYVKFGPLDQYLRTNKKKIKEVDLIEASSNLASALWHLEENGIVHGKIRCKKLLVYNHDENNFTVKLSDPGVSSGYASGEVHWIPTECYNNLNYAKHSTPADVWAFGTTLWEIFMFGEVIQQIDHHEAMKMYKSGKRLPKPQHCPTDIYQLMRECWDKDPHRRKQPQAIMRDINQLMYEVYNSRRVHSYAKINVSQSKNLSNSSYSLTSQETATTFIMDELLSMSDSTEIDSDLSVASNLNGMKRGWQSQDDFSTEDSISCDFSNILSNFNLSTATTSLDSINSIQSIFELDGEWNVVLQGKIGQGFYGEVYKATLEKIGDKDYEPRQVAVKKLKKSPGLSHLQDFEREISIMKGLKHPNIVEILGVLNEPEVSLVMEFVQHGSFQSYLKINKDHLKEKQLLKYASDITLGMGYLGERKIVHRDLAARNILVVDENHVKISDFGLAQVLGSDNYYIMKTNRDLPIKWYAPESLEEGKFSTMSDVWSYGVTLWEMFSYGQEPKLAVLEGKKIEGQEQQVLLKALQSGARYPCPPMCEQAIYASIIHPCWEYDPHNRPTFTTIYKQIQLHTKFDD